ncbi:MAG: transglycosylase domain-containing protein [Ktedonobacteraceae bacterium]|nr:transglycosylase domain-containing protein [Ktedonobacteraceae bacterium]
MQNEQQSANEEPVQNQLPEQKPRITKDLTNDTIEDTRDKTAEEAGECRELAVAGVPGTRSIQDASQAPRPARLPAYTRAAAAQRLNDVPEQPIRGVYYPVPHRQLQPPGWRTKRHLKRKNLHFSNLRYLATDRKTRWTMLPVAAAIMTLFLLLSTVLVTLSAINGATEQRYGQKVVTLQDILPKDNLKMYDAQGREIYQMTDQGLQTSVPLSQISVHLQHAEIAMEDQSFWNNPGYDITGIVRAALDYVSHGRVISGGSTITQQLIKNAIVGDQVTVTRKLQELLLAPKVTRYYTKEQILEMYLNTTYYGEQAYGAEAAAFTYFGLKATPGKSAASQLDIAQAAMLAGIPSAPVGRDPFLHPEASRARTQDVLRQMYLQNYISHDEYIQALDEIQQPNFLHRGVIRNNPVISHFTNYALNELAQELHVKISDLSRSGLLVSTTLDTKLQEQVLKIAQKHIAQMAVAHHMSNAAVTVIDFHNGAIRTLLGNIDPTNPRFGAFDVASQGYRQPGSAFKPFIYATAFARGISPGDVVLDAPLTIQMCCGLPPYTPTNYDLGYHGLVSYRYALQNSFNIPAVKLLMHIGVDNALHTAQTMGITSYEGTPNYTMVLGSLSVHLLDMTSAYGVFANGGVRVPPHAVDTVRDTSGHIIFHFPTTGTRVLSPQTAFMITDVLSDNTSRTFEFGKCSALYLYSNTQAQCYQGNPGPTRPAAAKTGTSNDFRDNWTVGYTTDYVVGVWAGNNDNSPMVNVTGVDGAGPIWHDTMLLVEQGHPIRSFPPPPPGVVKKTVRYYGVTTTDWYLQK